MVNALYHPNFIFRARFEVIFGAKALVTSISFRMDGSLVDNQRFAFLRGEPG
jgi:hypothetical protein